MQVVLTHTHTLTTIVYNRNISTSALCRCVVIVVRYLHSCWRGHQNGVSKQKQEQQQKSSNSNSPENSQNKNPLATSSCVHSAPMPGDPQKQMEKADFVIIKTRSPVNWKLDTFTAADDRRRCDADCCTGCHTR